MLTKYDDVRLKKDVKGPLQCVFMSTAYSEFFSIRGHQTFTYFQAYFFRKNYFENKKDSRGSRGVLPRSFLENLHTVVAILVLFEQFLRKFCLNFLPLNLSVSLNIMHFVRTFSIMRALGVRLNCY